MTTDERWVATRTVAASPHEIFAILSDPSRHKDTEPGDWVRDAFDTDRITGTGQVFAMNMYLERAGGPYVVHNLVTVFEQDRAIEWAPGLDHDGNHQPGGWTWRYDLSPNGSGTDVTLTYDWSRTPQSFRDQVPQMPLFGEEFLAASLDALGRSATE